jgi:hypothetical protein
MVINYLGNLIKVNLSNGFFYIGRVLEQDGDIIILLDKTNKKVQLNLKQILSLEVLS